MTYRNIVFVLGAGFSGAGGLPLQRDLLPGMLAFSKGDYRFELARKDVKQFIKLNFPGVSNENLTLEDLFTILDKAVLWKEYFGGFTWQALYEIRKGLVHTLLVLIDDAMKVNTNLLSRYQGMREFVTDRTKNRNKTSIISLNWDTLFEWILNDSNQGNKNKTSIDYCTFNHLLKDPEQGNLLFQDRASAIKIMKLHGSINWLYCSNCARLYTDFNENIGINFETICPCCPNIDKQGISMEEMIITPTMLKEFQNHHLKLAWQHAFMELNQADIVVFIGYSLPIADFELRYFFKKALLKKTIIQAVLQSSDQTNGTKERYKNFFGSNIQFCFDGFEGWWKRVPFK